MFIEEIRRAVQAAPRSDLARLAGVVWRAYAAGAIGEGEAQEASEAIEARKALSGRPRPATGRRCGSRPRSSESLARRRRWCASGRLPPQLACQFTQAENAALAVVAAEIVKTGDCQLPIGQIAARAGICQRSVRNAIRAAERLGMLTIEERRRTAFRNDPNVIRIVSSEWRGWLRLEGGCKTLQRTPTVFSFLVSSHPSSAFKGPSNKQPAKIVPHWRRQRTR
jgi:hypothetical protein